jgi:phenylacetate-CoA ligase
VKFLFAGGENISESARKEVEDTWGSPLYLNYGQTESFGALGAECRLKDGYHRNDLYFFFEVVDVDADGFGEVVYTTLSQRAMPLIRYRSSDLTRLVDERCECGISMGRLAKIRSRCDEMVVCGMGNVGPWVFDEVLLGIPGISDDWQVVIGHAGTLDLVVLHIELDDPSRPGAVETRIHNNLRDRFADFWRNREMRLYELRVVVHAVGSLRGQARKLRRVIDERQMSPAPSIASM